MAANPLLRSSLAAALDLATFRCAIVLCDELWVDPDNNDANGLDGVDVPSVLRLDSLVMVAQVCAGRLAVQRCRVPCTPSTRAGAGVVGIAAACKRRWSEPCASAASRGETCRCLAAIILAHTALSSVACRVVLVPPPVQLNMRKLLEDRKLPAINVICQKVATEGLTRFEDRHKLPLGISVNFNSYSAKLLAQVGRGSSSCYRCAAVGEATCVGSTQGE